MNESGSIMQQQPVDSVNTFKLDPICMNRQRSRGLVGKPYERTFYPRVLSRLILLLYIYLSVTVRTLYTQNLTRLQYHLKKKKKKKKT